MKKTLFLVLLIAFCGNGFSQTLLFQEYFDGGKIPATWSTIDKDGDTYSWYGDTWDNPAGFTESYVVSESWNSVAKALTPENYLVSPKIDLTGLQGTVSLRYTIQVGDADYPQEHFKVAVSTTGKTIADFTNIVNEETCTATDYFDAQPSWHPRNIDLTPFIGKQIYLTFCHYNCTDMYKLYLDSIQVSYTTNVGLSSRAEANNIIACLSLIKNTLQVTGNYANAKMQLFSADGREVYRTIKATNQKSINISSLKNGVYMMRIESSKGILTKKINISH
jgi:hypothetical protein